MSSDHAPTDVILMRMRGCEPDWVGLIHALTATSVWAELRASVGRCAWNDESNLGYLYVELPWRVALSMAEVSPLREAGQSGRTVELSRLTLMRDEQGADPHGAPIAHYTVEMTPEAGWEVELQRWYDTEHLPGLARVPGCVRARRFWNRDAGPRSIACYDLLDASVMGSREWLAVRQTAWSSRARPHFTETVRTMFTVAAA